MRVAKAIHCAMPEKSWIFSLADALKAYCRVNGWMGEKDSRMLQLVGTDVIRNADWIIDLGPEGGEKGGFIVAEGSPKDIAKNKKSYTGQYLRGVV